jgi:hypothetical protein
METLGTYFGRCLCGGDYETRLVETTLPAAGVTLDDVRRGECPKCGARVYKAGALEVIEAINGGVRPSRTASSGYSPARTT